MIVIPAIDLQGGQAVRLFKGDYNQKTVYSDRPWELAKGFEQMGAKYLHVVDLDGAKSGSAANIDAIKKIRKTVAISLQIGGGIRNESTVSMYLDEVKMNRVILGTAALENKAFLAAMLEKYGAEKIVVGVDIRGGKVATSGWLNESAVDYLDFIEELKKLKVKYTVVTDISRDGTLTGPNWEIYKNISGINFVVSGGISCDADIEKAQDCYGVIVGKAYYEKRVDLEKWLQKE